MAQHLTPAEFRERYRVAREVDRIERQHALQHFKNHWRTYLLERLGLLLGHALFGYLGGLAVFTLSVAPFLSELSTAVAKVCGQ